MSSLVSISTTNANVSPTSNNIANSNNINCSGNNNSISCTYDTVPPYCGNITSPSKSDGKNQNLDDSNGNNKIKSKISVHLDTMDSTSRSERDSLTSTNSLIRQSDACGNSCSLQFNESSPNNGDSSNSSSNASHIINESNKSNEEDKLHKQTTKKGPKIKEDESGKSTSSSFTPALSSINTNTKSSIQNQPVSCKKKVGLLTTVLVKDEKELLKKEETLLSSPNMSPVGFGSIGVTQVNDCNGNPGPSTSDKTITLREKKCSDNGESSDPHTAGALLVPGCVTDLNNIDGFFPEAGTSAPVVANSLSTSPNVNFNASFIINNLSTSNSATINGGCSGINTCMEYMQQQNHIFVFSTQLANKGAEAVLSNQFPTIIAYHCTQPATKSFFEDFFLKNPLKMTKLQRQNTLNIIGGTPTGVACSQPPWITGNVNSIGKLSHKLPLNKTVGGALNESDMICWDQSRSILDSIPGSSSIGRKVLEITDNSNNSANPASTVSNDESSGIPSLQGVKVPNESLTPQQRQHREEQLAKLKKMNQFLFPENGTNDYHPQTVGNNPMVSRKLQVSAESEASRAMLENSASILQIQGQNNGNKLNSAAMHHISANSTNHAKICTSTSQLDNRQNLVEDIMCADIVPSSGCVQNDIGVISIFKQDCTSSSTRNLMNAAKPNLNMVNTSVHVGVSAVDLMNDATNTIIGNSSEILSPFNSNNCHSATCQDGAGSGGKIGQHKNINLLPPHLLDMNSTVEMPQTEWPKIHHHIYDERLKSNNLTSNKLLAEITSSSTACQQNLSRCNITGSNVGGTSVKAFNTINLGNQGPPPPYHPTQRSASVPIATQSSNPSSPSNPTSNMSLPSPRASNNVGIFSSGTSPVMDASSTSAPNITTTAPTTSVCTVSGSSGLKSKHSCLQQGSPTLVSVTGNASRNRSATNLNSNPTTPILHVSPKDIDSKNMNPTSAQDYKFGRHRSRSPLFNDITNNNTMEPKYSSPGLNFTTSGASTAYSQNIANNFKNQNANVEHRQNLQHMPSQFCRRADNMPLNPNNNRNNQNKISNTFDPISSLAQMSQQLTGGGAGINAVSLGSSQNSMSALISNTGAVSDMNINSLMGAPMMGGGLTDPNINHCNPNGGGNISMSGLGGGPASMTASFNCNMMSGNPEQMCQRLLNPKVCGQNISGGFTSNQIGGIGMRDVHSGFSSMMPSQRMMNHRMPGNIGNFNMSPNIHVKASTPNTIQYMPVRPQNNSNNNNMRVPPSLEFLQRFANPHIVGNSGCSQDAGSRRSLSDIHNSSTDINKMSNTNTIQNAMDQMHFFGNCNQVSAIGGMDQQMDNGGGDQEELQGGGGIIPTDDHMAISGSHPPILTGMRPMRQGGLQCGANINTGLRMQHSGIGNNSTSSHGKNQFIANDNESLDCNDPINTMFHNAATTTLYQQKNNKLPPMGMPHTPSHLNSHNSNNVALGNNINLINDQNPSSNAMQISVIMGRNNEMLSSNLPNSNIGCSLQVPGNIGYKPFPLSNDLKYAQQYHSFQQQLYATSTRNQQPEGVGQQHPGNAISHNNSMAGFFVNK